jgi:hypothetical protein
MANNSFPQAAKIKLIRFSKFCLLLGVTGHDHITLITIIFISDFQNSDSLLKFGECTAKRAHETEHNYEKVGPSYN